MNKQEKERACASLFGSCAGVEKRLYESVMQIQQPTGLVRQRIRSKETKQLDLFSPNYAESGNENQLPPVWGEQPSTGECSTQGCVHFLPAAGNRNNDGSMNNDGSNGNYWSSEPNGSDNAYNLNFNDSNVNGADNNNNNRVNGHSVRCVAASASEESALFPAPVFELTKEDLLVDLFRAYYDARKHKRNSRNQLTFEMNLESNLIELRDELMERSYKVGRSTCFVIEDPVKREIFAADFRDRVIHHLLFNYIMPVFEPTFIADSYSCRKGKGTLYGVRRLEHHLRSCSRNYTHRCYILKMDIQGYFMSINRLRLLAIVREELMKQASRTSDSGKGGGRRRLDYRLIFYLLEEIILTDPTQNCRVRGRKSDWQGLPAGKSLFSAAKGCGLPIGNLTSQLFSNIYMNQVDQFVKRELGQKHYGRYVDDSFIVSRDRALLKEHLGLIRTFLLNVLGLTIHPKKISLVEMNYGVSYLGIFVRPYRKYVDSRTAKKIFGKVASLSECANPEQLRSYLNSYLGYLNHYKCGNLKTKLFEQNAYWQKYGFFDAHYRKFMLTPPSPAKPTSINRIN